MVSAKNVAAEYEDNTKKSDAVWVSKKVAYEFDHKSHISLLHRESVRCVDISYKHMLTILPTNLTTTIPCSVCTVQVYISTHPGIHITHTILSQLILPKTHNTYIAIRY